MFGFHGERGVVVEKQCHSQGVMFVQSVNVCNFLVMKRQPYKYNGPLSALHWNDSKC